MAVRGTLRLLGDEIRSRRLAAGLSQDVLAAKAGVHRNFIGMIERGERNFTILVFEAITNVLKVSMSEVIVVVEKRKK